MQTLKLLLSFSPWIALMVLARGNSLMGLQIAVAVAAALVLVMTVFKLHCGAIMWGSILYFSTALVLVTIFRNMWFIRHMGIFAHGTLFAFSLYSIVVHRPFTLDYARLHTPKSIWNQPAFIHSCTVIAWVWCLVFAVNTMSAAWQLLNPAHGKNQHRFFEMGLMICAVFFTSIYTNYARRKRRNSEAKPLSDQKS